MPLPGAEAASLYENAQDRAYQELRNWILYGPLKPGEMIRDVDVAELLGISRTPVREAIIRLTQEGLITVGKGRKSRVSVPDISRAADLYRVGAQMDAMAAQDAIAHFGPQHLETLLSLNERMDAETEPATLVALDLAFHNVFRQLAGPVLQEFLNLIEAELSRLERFAFGDAQIRSLTRSDHLAIIEAFKSGKPDTAGKAVMENWLNAWSRLSERLAEQKPQGQGT